MLSQPQLHAAYSAAANYPDLVKKLIAAGVTSYTVDSATGSIIYRGSKGDHLIHKGVDRLDVANDFNQEAVIAAIRDNQQGKTDYPGFMKAIAKAGVQLYEATLEGDNKRVTYIGYGTYYEERIPV